jgi:hypothetical protein
VGTETLRTHAEAAGTELEGEQRLAIAQVQATQEPPSGYTPVAETLVVETDGVMARYRDCRVDGTLIEGEWHEIKLGLVAGWQAGQLVDPSYIAARETATNFAPRLGTEAARRGSLNVVDWRGGGQRWRRPGGRIARAGGRSEVDLGARSHHFGSERIEILDWYHCCQHFCGLSPRLCMALARLRRRDGSITPRI